MDKLELAEAIQINAQSLAKIFPALRAEPVYLILESQIVTLVDALEEDDDA